MNLWKIALRSVEHRRLASSLTALSIGLGVALVVGVMVIHGVVSHTFRRSGEGYDLIIGARGSRLELVLNTVYHIGKPVGTLPYKYYEEFESGRFAGGVELAVPCCMGGNFRGFRVIGTTPDMFDELPFSRRQVEHGTDEGGAEEEREEPRLGEQDEFADSSRLFAEGNNFGRGDFFSGVIGASVARKTALKVGDKFRPVHGFDAEQGEEHDEFTVVGILKPTGTANDRALFINIEGFWLIHNQHHFDKKLDVLPGDVTERDNAANDEHNEAHTGHKGTDRDHAGDSNAKHDHEHETGRRVTAILIRTDGRQINRAATLSNTINQAGEAQAAMPAEEVARLLQGIVGNIQAVLMVFAVMIVLVAGIGMMVSIYNSMSERRHEIAVMRALGARRNTVMSIILLESILLSLGGGIVGLVLGHALIGLLAPQITEHTGVVVHALQFQAVELILIPGLVLMASIVGYLPAVIAYRTEVVDSLSK